jgi:hypothetical protein
MARIGPCVDGGRGGGDTGGMKQKSTQPPQNLAMTAGEWRLRLAELCCDCPEALPSEGAEQLSKAHDLLALAPDAPGMETLLDHLPPRARFDTLLEVGAYDTAAAALMPESASYILSRSTDGECLASVLLPGMDEEMTSQAQSPAMAMISALAACLASAASAIDPTIVMAPGQRGRREEAVVRCGDTADDVAQWRVPAGTLLN